MTLIHKRSNENLQLCLNAAKGSFNPTAVAAESTSLQFTYTPILQSRCSFKLVLPSTSLSFPSTPSSSSSSSATNIDGSCTLHTLESTTQNLATNSFIRQGWKPRNGVYYNKQKGMVAVANAYNQRSFQRDSITPVFFNFHQKRSIIHAYYAPVAPRPPPREYEADGSLRRYKTNAIFWDHGMHWTRWQYKRAGIFHMLFEGHTSEECGVRSAYREQFRWWAQLIPILTIGSVATGFVYGVNSVGISPQVYTVDWIQAGRERDRAENSYPFTRYLDRRRKERGPHWMVAKGIMNNNNWPWQSGQRDTAYLRARAIKARKNWLEQEKRRLNLEKKDRELEELQSGDEVLSEKSKNEDDGGVDDDADADETKLRSEDDEDSAADSSGDDDAGFDEDE